MHEAGHHIDQVHGFVLTIPGMIDEVKRGFASLDYEPNRGNPLIAILMQMLMGQGGGMPGAGMPMAPQGGGY